jgi:hypothetical protein
VIETVLRRRRAESVATQTMVRRVSGHERKIGGEHAVTNGTSGSTTHTLNRESGAWSSRNPAREDKRRGQATKGTWWMPWRQEAMKDAATCEKPRGTGSEC